jgi:hypothetical protein
VKMLRGKRRLIATPNRISESGFSRNVITRLATQPRETARLDPRSPNIDSCAISSGSSASSPGRRWRPSDVRATPPSGCRVGRERLATEARSNLAGERRGEDEPAQRARHSPPRFHFAKSDVGLPVQGRSFGLRLRSDGSLTDGYSGSSSNRPNGPSSRSMDERSGGRSDGSSSPST